MIRGYTLPRQRQIQHLAILVAFLGWGWCCLAATPAMAQAPVTATPPLLGFHVGQADALHLAAAQAAGGHFVVVVFNWANIEPEPGYLYWEQPDAAVRAAHFYGLDLIARLDQPPDWAIQPGQPLPFDRAAYANFARQVAERYKDQLAGVILWNEPNLNLEWHNQPPAAHAYVDLIKATYPAIKSVAPKLPVALAGLASAEGEGDWAINDLDYLQAIYDAGGSAYFDVLTAHPYGFGRPPDDPPAKYHPNFRRLELYRELMVAHGDAAKPVWVTEAGWLVRTDKPKYRWQVVTPRQQADNLLGVISYAQSHYPWLERLGLWQLNRRGDPYGYELWSGPAQWSLAYRMLVQSCASRSQNCDAATSNQDSSRPDVTILAPDVAIRLGDRKALQPQWVHLYHNESGSSLTWQGEFYLTPAQAERPFDLLLETMLVGQSNDRVVLNGQDLAYLTARPRPDPTSTWVTQRLAVPAGLLRAGANRLALVAGPRNPARQYVAGRWENFQFRHIRLEPTSPLPAPLLTNWQLQPSPPGWSETDRLRPGLAGDLWLTGSRPGEIWRLDSASTGLVNQAGNQSGLVFNDVLPLAQGELAATRQGLFWRPRQQNDWQPVTTAPIAMSYVVAQANRRFYAGFEGEGLWQAASPTGPWQRTSLTATTILDLAVQRYTLPGQLRPVERLYASSATELWQNNGLDDGWQALPLPGLTQAELDQTGESPGDKLRPRLFITSDSQIVIRAQDRLWRWGQTGWELFGPEELAANF